MGTGKTGYMFPSLGKHAVIQETLMNLVRQTKASGSSASGIPSWHLVPILIFSMAATPVGKSSRACREDFLPEKYHLIGACSSESIQSPQNPPKNPTVSIFSRWPKAIFAFSRSAIPVSIGVDYPTLIRVQHLFLVFWQCGYLLWLPANSALPRFFKVFSPGIIAPQSK